MNGVLNLNKSAGVTSHDEVLRAREILGVSKIGHMGTLDPFATGVLPLCIGKATKLVPYLENSRKSYLATMKLGVATDTMDGSGRVLETRAVGPLPEQIVHRTLERFCGEIEQIPPMYSAVKVRGRRLYKLARLGIEVEREPRKVIIHRLALKGLREHDLTVEVECSRGTYIRVLCDDIGQVLGCGAFLLSLVRTQVGPFLLRDAVSSRELKILQRQGDLNSVLWPLDRVLSGYPRVQVPARVAERVRHGAPFSEALLEGEASAALSPGTVVRVYDPEATLLALAELQSEQKDSLSPRVFRISRMLVAP